MVGLEHNPSDTLNLAIYKTFPPITFYILQCQFSSFLLVDIFGHMIGQEEYDKSLKLCLACLENPRLNRYIKCMVGLY